VRNVVTTIEKEVVLGDTANSHISLATVPNFIVDYLYFSATSFTALGYGNWVTTPNMWVRVVGVSETLFGVVMIASFVATLARKMARL